MRRLRLTFQEELTSPLDCAESAISGWLDNLAADEVVLCLSDNCDDSEYGCAAGFDPNTCRFRRWRHTVYVCVELVGETTASLHGEQLPRVEPHMGGHGLLRQPSPTMFR